MTTEFSKFAKLLKKAIGGKKSSDDFVAELFEEACKGAPNNCKVLNMGPSTYRSYFSGTNDITGIADEAIQHFNQKEFIDWIDSFDAQLPTLIELLEKEYHYTDLNVDNVPNKCSEIFKSILLGTFNSSKEALSPNIIHLLSECGERCAQCGIVIRKKVKGVVKVKYTLKHIVPEEYFNSEKKLNVDIPDSFSSIENQTLLCDACLEQFSTNTNQNDIINLLTKKRYLARNYDTICKLDVIELEEEIEKIIDTLYSQKHEDVTQEELSFHAFNVSKKIKSDLVLLAKIQIYANMFYKYVERLSNEYGMNASGSFDEIASQVRQAFVKLRNSGLSQSVIFNELVDWIGRKTCNKHREACEIVVAFFVQNCEVFDVIAE